VLDISVKTIRAVACQSKDLDSIPTIINYDFHCEVAKKCLRIMFYINSSNITKNNVFFDKILLQWVLIYLQKINKYWYFYSYSVFIYSYSVFIY